MKRSDILLKQLTLTSPRTRAVRSSCLLTVHRKINTTLAPGIIASSPSFRSHSTASASSSSTSPSSSNPTFSSINASEISHFSRLSSQWWSETGEFKLLHRMNPPRIEYIRKKVALDPALDPPWTYKPRSLTDPKDHHPIPEELRGTGQWLAGKRCLDVGCGGGLFSESLARLGGDVIGLDASPENIGIAKLHASQDPWLPLVDGDDGKARNVGKKGSLEYRCTSAEALARDGEKFDLVCGMEVLEHVDEPGEFMKCLGEMVKPGGHLILSTISRTPLSQLLTLTLAEDILKLVTPGTHTFSKFIKPEELRKFVFSEMGGYKTWEKQDNGDDIRKDQVGETRGIVYDPIGGVWRLWGGAPGTWGKEMGEFVNYMYHAKKRLDA